MLYKLYKLVNNFCKCNFSYRYWNDEEVLRKLGLAIGLPNSGDAAASAETSGPEETEDVGNEDESIVHQTASVGDVEVCHGTTFLCF